MTLVFLALFAGLTALPTRAETVAEVIQILRQDGYTVTDIGRTFLGRIRIEAVSDTHLREVILSASTGEIKQDAIFAHRPSPHEATRDED